MSRPSPGIEPPDLPTTCFSTTRLSRTTFKIVEDDVYGEQPFIYVKIYPSVILLVDTGCGGKSKEKGVQVKQLRRYIEKYPIADNAWRPLNDGGSKPYVVVQTHLHYDHICGMPQFEGSTIIASGYSKLFVTCDLPTHSLCKSLGIDTPKYTITSWAADCSPIFYRDLDLRIEVLHTPGHTPDSLALWCDEDKMLFVGDTLYEYAPTIFPPQGDIVDWLGSMDKLREYVKEKMAGSLGKDQFVTINCGHITAGQPALEVLEEMQDFMEKVLRGKVPRSAEESKGGEKYLTYGGTGRFLITCPERLILAAREKLEL